MPTNTVYLIDYSPKPARGCRCEEPFGDPREGTCARCGHQVGGIPLGGGSMAFPTLRESVRPARKRPRYRSAL